MLANIYIGSGANEMKLMHPVLVFIILVGLVGCATNTEQQAVRMSKGINAALYAENSCLQRTLSKPAVARSFTFLVSGNDDPDKLQKQNDPQYIDDILYADLVRAHQLRQPCRAAFESQLGSIHSSYAQAVEAAFAANEQVLLELLNRRITIGQANQKFVQIDLLYDQAWHEAGKEVDRQLAARHQVEMQQQQSVTAAMQNFYVQQQALRKFGKISTSQTANLIIPSLIRR